MNKIVKPIGLILTVFLMLGYLTSCEDFFNPKQDVTVTEDQLYTDWYEYRSAAVGLYALQQDLVEQLVVLGELRADLLTVTENANADLREIYNFNISKTNKYASPNNFFKLIAATNRLISILETEHPDVKDPSALINNYDRLYGEALCMRAWAYFNAVRIYGKVPFIDQNISTIEEINDFIGSSATYIDSVYIQYSIDGYNNDTIHNREVVLDKQYFDTERVILHFTDELENKVKAVGVNHYINNDDASWEVTIWSTWSYNTLLGHMFLTLGDLSKSAQYFEQVIYNSTENNRYQLDDAFAYTQWPLIFMNVDSREHILTIPFSKANEQQNELQRLFDPRESNDYMLKPTKEAIHKWETQWRGTVVRYDYTVLDSTKTMDPGFPGDPFRGYGASYLYTRNNVESLPYSDYIQMLEYKRLEEYRSVASIMENVDTIVYKYLIGNDEYDQDPNFIIYRGADVNLYVAEIYNFLNFIDGDGDLQSYTLNALNIINNGSNYDVSQSRDQMGVRGRVNFGFGEAAFKITNYTFKF
ncbi:MAG: RagB/SusD family nutrient uptake outer membrane protein, partial [Prolixibacteraceae bacterium]|nr:RagB/SusD family nutrient uptake outer membrane protein [Prolixibacteraceae bacterium]